MVILTALGNQTSAFENDNSESIIRRALSDSIYLQFKNKPIIFYSCGHHGYIWSLIVKIDSGYRALSGRVGYGGGRHINPSSESNHLDSTMLFSQNRTLLSWGLDSLSSEINKMKKVRREHYVTFYENLSVFNSDGKNVFNSDDAIAYSGPDSVIFNKKFHKLCLIMRCLSDSTLRKYIPDSAIY